MSGISKNNKRVVITSGCMACGVCMASSSHFREAKDGTAIVRGAGIISNDEIMAIQKIAEDCPAHVISLQNVEVKSRDELLHLIQDSLDNYKMPIPPKEKFNFNNENITVPIPYE